MGNKSGKLAPIKEISGRLLLYFYLIQRIDPVALLDSHLTFQMRFFTDPKIKSPVLTQRSLEIMSGIEKMGISDADLYNSLHYLRLHGFISASVGSDNISEDFLNIQLTATGIDIIEAIERGEEEKRIFNITFNINVENTTNIESLLKTNLGSIFTGLGVSL